jgi:hypothetical protein
MTVMISGRSVVAAARSGFAVGRDDALRFLVVAALVVGGAVLVPRCADPVYRRSVKVSMGAVFALAYVRMLAWNYGLPAIRPVRFRR